MTGREVAGLVALIGVAAATLYVANSLRKDETEDLTTPRFEQGYYLRAARIFGTGEDGSLLYEIEAAYAQQRNDEFVEFEDVQIVYTPEAGVPWTVRADTAVISSDRQRLVFEGHVVASGERGPNGEEAEIRTDYLELEPDAYRASTDERVQIRIGARSLTATGMLASLNDSRFILKSNVSGKFVP